MCAEDIKRAAVVCRYCGHRSDDPAPVSPGALSLTEQALVPAPRGAYRRPRRVLLVGAVVLFVGLFIAVAAFIAIQVSGTAGYVATLGLPAINAGLKAFGIRQQVPGASGGGLASTIPVLVFVAGSFLVVVGSCLLIWGAVWHAVVFSPRARAKAMAEGARPVAAQLARHGVQGVSGAAERGQQGFERARPTLARTADTGKQIITDGVLPLVSAGAKRGRKRWNTAVPILGAAAARRMDRLRGSYESRAADPNASEVSDRPAGLAGNPSADAIGDGPPADASGPAAQA
jgi:hypothetical protein